MRITLLVLLFLAPSCVIAQEGRRVDVWFGTAANKLGLKEGVYVSQFSQDAEYLSPPKLVHEIKGAGWVSPHPTIRGVMYVTGIVDGKPSVLAINRSSRLSVQPIGDGGSCFVTTDKTGKLLLSAQYGGGSIAVFPVNDDGRIQPRCQLIEHEGGSKVVGKRQDAPHPHYIAISPDNRFAFAPDLGLDRLVTYEIDLTNRRLIPHGTVDVELGSGPRHMKFHTSGKFAFVLNELSLSVTIFRYDKKRGTMEKLRSVPTLNEAEKKENRFNSASEIRVHRSGNFVYTANRGHDSISVFRFDEDSGQLKRTQLVPIHGSWPRNFAISPDGDKMLVAGRDSNTITVFSVSQIDASLSYIQHRSTFIPAPICVTFVD